MPGGNNEDDSIIGERLATARCELIPVTAALARRIQAGEYDGLRRGDGWPHADTTAGASHVLTPLPAKMWMISVDGRVIGDCGTHGPPDPAGQVEIGYGIAAPYRGLGFGTEAVSALSSWLVDQPGVGAVLARTSPENVASRRVLVSAGFRLASETPSGCTYVLDAPAGGS